MSLDVRPDHLKIVLNILNKYVPDREVWAFGSRATGNARETSDLDLVIIGETPLDFETLAALRDAFSESRIPYKVDVVDWATISETFREIIWKDKVVIQSADTFSRNSLYHVDFPIHWLETTIGQQVTLQRGIDITKTEQRAGNIPVISSGGIQSYHDSAQLKGPGVILGRKGVVGSVYYVESDYWPHDTTLWVKNFHGNEPRFVYYFFKKIANKLASMDTGSANPTLNRNHVHTINTLWPPLPEQRAIAHILGTLDDKIELNRRMNETLEAMAQALFKSWFVDFDPVRAKMEGRPTGLPKEIEDLFPDSFEDSKLGEIPKGWSVVPFTNVLEIVGGGTPKTSIGNYWNGNIPWFSVEDSPNESDIWVIDTKRKITEEGLINSSTKILPIGAVIITARGTVGRIALVGVPMAMNQSCYGICGKFPANFWTYFSIKELIAGLKQNVHGSVFDTITRNTLERIFLVFPPNKILEVFENQVQSTLNNIRLNLNESKNLSNIRQVLLPRLLSGDIRVEQPFGNSL